MSKKRSVLLVLILVGLAGGTAAESAAQTGGNHGAIATSDSDARVWGYSVDHPTRAQAERRALEECGRSDCQVRLWFQNGCGSVATNGTKSGWGWAPTRAEAEARAIAACGRGNCQVEVWACTTRQ